MNIISHLHRKGNIKKGKVEQKVNQVSTFYNNVKIENNVYIYYSPFKIVKNGQMEWIGVMVK